MLPKARPAFLKIAASMNDQAVPRQTRHSKVNQLEDATGSVFYIHDVVALQIAMVELKTLAKELEHSHRLNDCVGNQHIVLGSVVGFDEVFKTVSHQFRTNIGTMGFLVVREFKQGGDKGSIWLRLALFRQQNLYHTFLQKNLNVSAIVEFIRDFLDGVSIAPRIRDPKDPPKTSFA